MAEELEQATHSSAFPIKALGESYLEGATISKSQSTPHHNYPKLQPLSPTSPPTTTTTTPPLPSLFVEFPQN